MDAYPATSHIDVPVPLLADDMPSAILLKLKITDPELVAEFSRHREGEDRDEFAISALRVGVMAIRQAGGALDTAAMQREAERVLAEVDKLVTGNARELAGTVSTSLKEYFDPGSGKLSERLDRLVKKDGELSAILSHNIDGDSSRLAQTLLRHVGEQSPLFKMLSPGQKDGLLFKVDETLNKALEEQRNQILKQFSLDENGSALSRLVKEISDGNGRLRNDLSTDLGKVQQEFSLDNENGALSRLVGRVERTQRAISDEFSKDNENSALNRLTGLLEKTHQQVSDSLTLDNETSPLSRLSRELREQIRDLAKQSAEFHAEVRQTLEVEKARKQEAARGTQHGVEFEALVGQIVSSFLKSTCDTCEPTGNSVGNIQRCKIGDHVVTLGPDSAAPGARIVIECKEKESCTEEAALLEIKQCRANRDSQVGVFVFSKSHAPATLSTLRRVGDDILCVWNKDDAGSDIVLESALSIARALVVRQKTHDARAAADFTQIESAVNKLAKDAEKLGEIMVWSGNIARDSKKILECVEPIRGDIEAQIIRLRQSVADLKQEPA